jgi:hypothetical protein
MELRMPVGCTAITGLSTLPLPPNCVMILFLGAPTMANPKVATVAFIVAVAFILVILLLPATRDEVTASMPTNAAVSDTRSK